MNLKSNSTRLQRVTAAFLGCVLLLLLPSLLLAAAGRGGDARELTRPRAAALLRNSPQAFDLIIYFTLHGIPDSFVRPLFDDEPEERVLARAVEDYFKDDALAVLRYLGYVDAKAVVTTRPQRPREPWRLSIKPFLTERGLAFARRAGGRYNNALPLGKKQLVEITGIVTQRPHAVVEFTWRPEPTELAAVFDPQSAAFQKLPAELQERLQQRGGARLPRDAAGGWSRVRSARATLQLFDDGWRVRGVL